MEEKNKKELISKLEEKLYFINIHSHSIDSISSNEIRVINIYPECINIGKLPQNNNLLFSSGMHPWFIKDASDSSVSKISEYSKELLFIGETGLDRMRGPSLEVQEKVFLKHLEISEIEKLPVVLHCVRAFPELIVIRKKRKILVPWIIHGYMGNLEIANSLVEHGIMISFGAKLLKSNKLQNILNNIQLKYILFETDDSKVEIQEIYNKASGILNIDLDKLKEQIQRNFIELISRRSKDTLFQANHLVQT